jgi:hypothetical protein
VQKHGIKCRGKQINANLFDIYENGLMGHFRLPRAGSFEMQKLAESYLCNDECKFLLLGIGYGLFI